jgi:hypothetical protein
MDRSDCLGIVVNIEAELTYWKTVYSSQPFHANRFTFPDYVPSLKFSYDAFLLFPKQDVFQLIPELQRRYERGVPSHQRLEWERASKVLLAVWKRVSHHEVSSGKAANTRLSYMCAT